MVIESEHAVDARSAASGVVQFVQLHMVGASLLVPMAEVTTTTELASSSLHLDPLLEIFQLDLSV